MPELLPPPECANCGAAIPRTARACPECGADEQTGWREASIYDGLELPETAWRDENDEDIEKPQRAARRVNGVAWYWWAAGVVLIALLIAAIIGLR